MKKNYFVFLCFLFLLVLMVQSMAGDIEPVFAVNCGGGAFTASDGTEYAADTGFSGGSGHSGNAAISGTDDDALYQSERYGNSTYSIKVPNGSYRVILHFAETYHAEAGLRKFDVVMEGIKCMSGFDIVAKAGSNAAYTTENSVNVGDGELNIEFATIVENAKVNAIKVVLDGPGAALSYTPKMPVQGQTIRYDASASSNPKGTISGYSWVFEDGSKATGAKVSRTYPKAGDHKVTLEVTGNVGGSSSLTKTVKVYTGEPIADCTVSPTRSKPGETVTVDASASFDIDGTIKSYTVDYGDGTDKGSSALTSHTYPKEGKYTITVAITDNEGKTDTLTKELAVRNMDGFVVWSEGSHSGRELKWVEIERDKGPIGEKKTLVKRGDYSDIECVISFDGRWVAFARELESVGCCYDGPGDYHVFGNYDVYIARIDGELPAKPIKIGHGYWPSWGDDSGNPTKTLYYSYAEAYGTASRQGHDNIIRKTTVQEDGSFSEPEQHAVMPHQPGDAHMQCSPNGRYVAYRPGGIRVYDIQKGDYIGGSVGGCHPCWGPFSKYLIRAQNGVFLIKDGQMTGLGGAGFGQYHYGISNDGEWAIGKMGGGGQNSSGPIEYKPVDTSNDGWKVGNGIKIGNGTWCDIHICE